MTSVPPVNGFSNNFFGFVLTICRQIKQQLTIIMFSLPKKYILYYLIQHNLIILSVMKFQIINGFSPFHRSVWTMSTSVKMVTIRSDGYQWITSKWDNNKHTSSRKLNITKSQLIATFLKVSFNSVLAFKIFTAQTTTKLFVVRVYQLMRFQIMYCTKRLCTMTTYIRFSTFMAK